MLQFGIPVLSTRGVDSLFQSETGPVARELMRAGYRIHAEAVHLANNQMVNVRTGLLRESHYVTPAIDSRGLVVVIGNSAYYSLFVHESVRTRNGGRTRPRPWLRTAIDNVLRTHYGVGR